MSSTTITNSGSQAQYLQIGRKTFENVKPLINNMKLDGAKAITNGNGIDEIYIQNVESKQVFIAFGNEKTKGALDMKDIKQGYIGRYDGATVKVISLENEINTISEGAKEPINNTMATIKKASENGIVKGIADIAGTVTALFIGKTILDKGVQTFATANGKAVADGVKAAKAAHTTAKAVKAAKAAESATLLTKAKGTFDGVGSIIGSTAKTVAVAAGVAAVVVGTVAGGLAIKGAIGSIRKDRDFSTLDMVTDPKFNYPKDYVDKTSLGTGTIPATIVSFAEPEVKPEQQPQVAPSTQPDVTEEQETPISVYFTNVYSGDVNVPQNDPNNPDKQLANFIDTAKETLDLAVFELDSQVITDSIIRAHNRGVKVRVVTDDNYKDEESIKRLEELGIPVIDDGRAPLMHNKFIVVDHKAVWTGSLNTTDNCSYKNNNNAIKIYSDKLADNYTVEFNEMFEKKLFGQRSPDDTPNPVIDVGNTKIQNYFASEGNVAAKVADEIKNAKKSVHFMAFSFTEDGIGQAVIEKFNEGLEVKGVFENVGSGSQYSEYPKMREKGMDVKVDGNKYVMHHKVFIIDGEKVITGSYNFSNSAESKNDENIIMLENSEIAETYEQEFKRIYAQGTVKK